MGEETRNQKRKWNAKNKMQKRKNEEEYKRKWKGSITKKMFESLQKKSGSQ